MAKKVQSAVEVFDLSNVTAAINAQWGASHAWQLMQADMIQWHASKEYPENQALAEAIAASGRYTVERSESGALKGTVAVYASNILQWARSGELPKTIGQCIKKMPENHIKSKAGRKAGQGAGKSTKPEAKPEAKPELIGRPVEALDDVLLLLRTINSRVDKLGLSAAGAAAAHDAMLDAIAAFVSLKTVE